MANGSKIHFQISIGLFRGSRMTHQVGFIPGPKDGTFSPLLGAQHKGIRQGLVRLESV